MDKKLRCFFLLDRDRSRGEFALDHGNVHTVLFGYSPEDVGLSYGRADWWHTIYSAYYWLLNTGSVRDAVARQSTSIEDDCPATVAVKPSA